jgi:hypothetical protein
MHVNGHLHVTAALPPKKPPRYPLDRNLGGPQRRSGRYEGQKYRIHSENRTPHLLLGSGFWQWRLLLVLMCSTAPVLTVWRQPANHGLRLPTGCPEQSSKLLLVFASTVVLVFGPHLDPCPNCCSFQGQSRVLNVVPSSTRGGAGLSE